MCVENVIPPSNGASLGSFLSQTHIWTKGYLLGSWSWPICLLAKKILLGHYFIAKASLKNFRPFCSASLAISGVKFHDNRQTHKFLTQYTGVFFLMKFAISLVALLEGDKNVYYVVV